MTEFIELTKLDLQGILDNIPTKSAESIYRCAGLTHQYIKHLQSGKTKRTNLSKIENLINSINDREENGFRIRRITKLSLYDFIKK